MWYAAHAILSYRFCDIDGGENTFQVYENVYLIQAEDFVSANNLAVAIASKEANDTIDPININGRPARINFITIRKIISVQDTEESEVKKLRHGCEATYLELNFDDQEEYFKYISGQRSKCSMY